MSTAFRHAAGPAGGRSLHAPATGACRETSGPADIDRCEFVTSAARLGVAASTLDALDALAWMPSRADAATRRRPEVQFEIAGAPALPRTGQNVAGGCPPVYTSFVTLALRRRPSQADQERLQTLLLALERRHAPGPRGTLLTLAYGISYFERLPGGLDGQLARDHIPRLRTDIDRLVLEEAVAGPVDVSPSNPGIVKRTFGVPVRIESNDMLAIVRSDSTRVIDAVLAQLTSGPALRGLLRVTSRRLMFQQAGLPRKVAERERLPFASAISPRSPMWSAVADQRVTGRPSAAAVTFAGGPSARLTTAQRGDYFDSGAIVHLAHMLEDLEQFYGERTQCTSPPDPPPARAGSTPPHICVHGPGLDALDVPGGAKQPKLQFAMFVPTAQAFAEMGRAHAWIDRFVTATRRQNFLVPPRRHRAFPLVELVNARARTSAPR
jgi:hypothetical protein